MTEKTFEKYDLMISEWIDFGFTTKPKSDYGNLYYVYALINSLDDQVFYIGKGKNKRAESHKKEFSNGIINNHRKFKMISDIISKNGDVVIHVIEKNITETQAFKIERYFINKLKNHITNVQNGRLSQKEKDVIWAKDTLDRVLSFDKWVQKRNPNPAYYSLYKYIISEIEAIANGTKTIIRGVEQTNVNGVVISKVF